MAQDAFMTLRSCLKQFDDLDYEIERFATLNEDGEHIGRFNATIASLEKLRSMVPTIHSSLATLMELSESFWLCAPVDRTSTTRLSALQRWRIFQNGCIKDKELRLRIVEFREKCLLILKEMFPDLMEELLKEERTQADMTSAIRVKPFRFANILPYGVVQDLRNNILMYFASVSTVHPHFSSVDPRFADLLGFTVARMIIEKRKCFHKLQPSAFMKNMLDGALNQHETAPIMFYRTSFDTTVVIQWQFSSAFLEDTVVGFGMNMTRDMELYKTKQVEKKQRVLRQWLHSIRNASFEQQAADILEALTVVEKDIPPDDFTSDFAGLYDSIQLLISSAGATVDLIDQALDPRGQLQSAPFSDIVASATQYPGEFAQINNYGPISVKVVLAHNNAPCTITDFGELTLSYHKENVLKLLKGLLEHGVRLVLLYSYRLVISSIYL